MFRNDDDDDDADDDEDDAQIMPNNIRALRLNYLNSKNGTMSANFMPKTCFCYYVSNLCSNINSGTMSQNSKPNKKKWYFGRKANLATWTFILPEQKWMPVHISMLQSLILLREKLSVEPRF